MIETGLIIARFVHFAAVMALFGLALFPLYSFPPRTGGPPAWVGPWLLLWRSRAALLGLLGWLAWGWLTIVNMAGSVSAAADPDSLLSVMRDTSFGQVWAARLLLAVVLLALITGRSNGHHGRTIVLLAGLLLGSLAFVGHTQTSDGTLRIIHVSADGIHLLAAGAWLGGLLALGHLLVSTRDSPQPEHTADVTAALVRFSGMGYVAVAALIGSGLINAWLLIGSPTKLPTTPYGRALLLKLCLLAAMLTLAALNRFHLLPSLLGAAQRREPTTWRLRELRRNVIGEQVLGLALVLVVGYLGTIKPAIAALE